jgi:hypothetical protein
MAVTAFYWHASRVARTLPVVLRRFTVRESFCGR